jgi:hypothetical protein
MHTLNLILDSLVIGALFAFGVYCTVKLLDLAFPARASR